MFAEDSFINYLFLAFCGLVIVAEVLYWIDYLEIVLGWIVNINAIIAAVNRYIGNLPTEPAQIEQTVTDTATTPVVDVANREDPGEKPSQPFQGYVPLGESPKQYAWKRSPPRYKIPPTTLPAISEEERTKVYEFVHARKPVAQREKEEREAYEARMECIMVSYRDTKTPATAEEPTPTLIPAQMGVESDAALRRFIAGMRGVPEQNVQPDTCAFTRRYRP